MQLQEKISAQRLKNKVGRTLTVLVDAIVDGGAIARSTADAPEIDGLVHVTKRHPGARPGARRQRELTQDVNVGDFVQMKVTRSDAHDLYGTLVE
jgi:ribosomal protein S12 methylthiotransferase